MGLLMGMPPIIVASMLVLNRSFIRSAVHDPIGHTLLGGWNYFADDWIFRDPQDYPDSGLDLRVIPMLLPLS